MRHLVRLAPFGLSLALVGCGGADNSVPPGAQSGAVEGALAPESSLAAGPSTSLNEPTEEGEEVVTTSGLAYQTIRAGDGPQAKPGDRVVLHYVATIEGGEPIDSSRDRETPWTHTIGDSRAVQGFNEGIAGMKLGELRRLAVPANLAFGALGTFGEYAPGKEHSLDGAMQADELPSIPPNSTIIYEVELLEIASDSDPAAEDAPGIEVSPEADPNGSR